MKGKELNFSNLILLNSTFLEDTRMDMFFEDARYFLIKSGNSENVVLSKHREVWSTTPRNEEILNKAFRSTKNVILVFSVEKSQAFQGKSISKIIYQGLLHYF